MAPQAMPRQPHPKIFGRRLIQGQPAQQARQRPRRQMPPDLEIGPGAPHIEQQPRAAMLRIFDKPRFGENGGRSGFAPAKTQCLHQSPS
jgi:hypothetical protein